MAALYGSGIENCLIELSGEEFPILDGSAKYYVEEIEKVGFEEQKADRRYFTVKEQMEFCSEDGQTKITLLPDTDYNINLVVAYDSPYLQMQYATYSCLLYTSPSKYFNSMLKASLFSVLASVVALNSPTNSMSFVSSSSKLNVVGRGPFSGNLVSYRCHPLSIVALQIMS